MNIHNTLINNAADWYVVQLADGTVDLQHASQLSAILQCGAAPLDYDIADLQQCWGGTDLGEDSVTLSS